jgi:hypothetical protein
MKKVLLGILFSGLGFYAMGQEVKTPVPGPKGYIESPVKIRHNVTQNGTFGKLDQVNAWYDWVDAANAVGIASFQGYNNSTLFPDSLVKQIYGDNNGGTLLGFVGLHSVGSVFDPKSGVFENDQNGHQDSLSRFNAYKVDSVLFYFNYIRPDTSAVDTLLIQFYAENANASLSPIKRITLNDNSGGTTKSSTVLYNYKTNQGAGATKTMRYILSDKDTFSGPGYKGVSVPTDAANGGISVGANRLFAYTIGFRPGYKYSFGDTIDERWSPVPTKRLNHFKVAIFHDLAKTQPESQNHALHVTTDITYNKNAQGWNGQYLPGDAFLQYNEYLESGFHIIANNVGIEKETGELKGYGLGNIYPNPANGAASFDFTLAAQQNVKVELFNIVGQKVSTLAAGSYAQGAHKVSFSTEGMQPGVYFYTITAGEYTKTLKFTVGQ